MIRKLKSGRIPALLEKEKTSNGQTPQPGHVYDATGSRKA